MPQIQKKVTESGIVLLTISGRITLGRDCEDVEWAVDNLIRDSTKKIIFDLSGLDYVDSTGIGSLVMCSGKMSRAGGELRLASLQPRIVELMKITKLDQIWHFYPTAADAAANFEIANEKFT